MIRKLIASLLVFLFACSPVYASVESVTPSVYLLRSVDTDSQVAPAYLTPETKVNFSLQLYDSNLQGGYSPFSASKSVTVPWASYFTGSLPYRLAFIQTNPVSITGDTARFVIELYSPDNSLITLGNSDVSIGSLSSFFYKGYPAAGNGYVFPSDSFKGISYQLLKGTSFESAAWTATTKTSSKISGYGNLSEGYSFKLSNLPTAYTLIGSDFYSCYGIRIFVDFSLSNYLSMYSDFYGFINGFANTDCYVSVVTSQGGSASNEQNEQIIGGLDDINNGLANLGIEIQNMTNSIISELGASLNQLSQTVQSVTQSVVQLGTEINNTVTQQTQEIREALGLVGDSIDSGITNIQTSINNQITEIRNGFENITNEVSEGFEKTVESVDKGFEDTKKEINEIPGEIKNMLTDFIVPDEDTVSDKMDSFQSLAEEKLGIIYQVPEMMFDAIESLVDGVANPQTSMTFPAFSLPWIDGSQMRVWDSQEFDIIPAGLDNLRDLIQTVTSMVFVIMTFNSLKRAYERFFLGGDN